MITAYTRQTAEKILELCSHGLSHGLGKPEPGAMCVEAVVNHALGLPHGDEPNCVGSAVRSFKIALNDCSWSSNAARAAGLRKIAVAQLGSNTLDQAEFAQKLALSVIRKIVPAALRAAAGMKGNAKHTAELIKHALACECAPDLSAARYAASAASYAASAASAASAARYAASAASYAASDEMLTLCADCCLEVLVEMKSPGCEWLSLCD